MKKLEHVLKERARGFSRISKLSGITETRLKELANGSEPSLGELRHLAKSLKMKLSDFATASETEHEAELLFRRADFSGKAPPSTTINTLSRRMAFSFNTLKSREKPEWLSFFEQGEQTYSGAERNAERFRDLFFAGDQQSPLFQLPKIIAEKMGVLLFVVDSADIDGASAYIDGVPFIFVAKRFPPRMLFTLAHEVGHLVSHHASGTSFASLDGASDFFEAGKSTKITEQFAHAFAGCLLMPKAGIGIALEVIKRVTKAKDDEIGDVEILYLSRIYGVSFLAAAKRCEDLCLLPTGGALSLNDALIDKYGSAEKRAEELRLPPRAAIEFPPIPWSLMSAVIEKIRVGEISIGRAAFLLEDTVSGILAANSNRVH